MNDLNDEVRYRWWRIGSRLVLFLGAAGLLAWRCREGVSFAQVCLYLVLYVAAATLWVRGQHQASVDARRRRDADLRPYAPPCWVSGAAFVVGVVVAAIGLKTDHGTPLLVGVIGAYFALGYLLARYRRYDGQTAGSGIEDGTGRDGGRRSAVGRLRGWFQPSRTKHRGRVGVAVAMLACSTAASLVGLLLMEEHGWAALMVGAGVLAVPVGLAILAEPAVRYLQAQDDNRAAIVVGAFGGALLVAMAGFAALRVNSPMIALVAFAVISVLVLAIVSSTQADIAIVIAAICLMGVTSASIEKPRDLKPTVGDDVLVALGDSYMSGEGAKTYYREVPPTDGKPANRCHRAPSAWAAMAGQHDRLFDSVKFLACSGARTYNVQRAEGGKDSPQEVQYNEPGTQLDQYAAFVKAMPDQPEEFTPKLAVISLGGNDAGFSMIGVMCLGPGDCLDKQDLWEGSLPQLETALDETFAQVDVAFPRTPVLVTAYPNPIYSDPSTGEPASCDQVTLSSKDMQFISEFLPKLNDRVKDAATSHGFYFLDEMENALAGASLQLCDPANNGLPGINYIGLTSVGGIAEQRFNPKNWYHNSLHPNERGHAAMLRVFEGWLADHPDVRPGGAVRSPDAPADSVQPNAEGPGARAEADDAAPEAGTTVVDKRLCDLFDDQQTSTVECRAEGAKWVRGQIADKLLFGSADAWWGAQIAAAGLGAWLLSVALVGFWNPFWGKRVAPGTGAGQPLRRQRRKGDASDI